MDIFLKLKKAETLMLQASSCSKLVSNLPHVAYLPAGKVGSLKPMIASNKITTTK
jgi:hypothetical protein